VNPVSKDRVRHVRATISLAEVVGITVLDLKENKQGNRSLVGTCPAHDWEAVRSDLHVNTERGFFHCFGCKQSGSVIDWVMANGDVSFSEAVRFLEVFGNLVAARSCVPDAYDLLTIYEQRLLGIILIDPVAIEKAAMLVRPEHFWREEHRVIFGGCLATREHGVPLDIVSVGQRLKDEGRLTSSGGMAYLAELLGAPQPGIDVEKYARIVATSSQSRLLSK
jgi:hypothetical protein